MSGEPKVHAIKMPKWGLSMQEGTIKHWHVQPGDRVDIGAPLCDIETTKITNEFEAPESGIVARLLARPDDIVPIGRTIAILADEGARAADIDAAVSAASGTELSAEAGFAAPALRYIEAAGSALAYLEAGDGRSDSVVLFLHGFGGDHANWAMNQGAIAERHRTIAFDLPGHGASDKALRDGSAAALAVTIGAAAEALGGRRIHLVAHSFGAMVALAMIRSGFDPVSATLIAPVGLGIVPSPEYIRGFLDAERKRDLKPIMEMLFADPGMLGRNMVNDGLAALRDDTTRQALGRIAEPMLAAVSDSPTVPQSLAATRFQVIWGDRDRIVPLDPRLAELLEGRLHRIAQAGHMPHVEKPAAVNALIADFIEA
jgi:pyruvate dehydrogenase E2 component (dihydrolipoamide acetyltransferase)